MDPPGAKDDDDLKKKEAPKEDEKKDLRGQIKHLEAEVRKQIVLKWLAIGGAIFVIILTLVYGNL